MTAALKGAAIKQYFTVNRAREWDDATVQMLSPEKWVRMACNHDSEGEVG